MTVQPLGLSRKNAPLPGTSTLTISEKSLLPKIAEVVQQRSVEPCESRDLHLHKKLGTICPHRTTRNRFMELKAGLRHAKDRSKLSGQQLEALVGHCIYEGLRRRSLSAFHCCYQFTPYSHALEVPVWGEVVAVAVLQEEPLVARHLFVARQGMSTSTSWTQV